MYIRLFSIYKFIYELFMILTHVYKHYLIITIEFLIIKKLKLMSLTQNPVE
jgi:hypothetical protein